MKAFLMLEPVAVATIIRAGHFKPTAYSTTKAVQNTTDDIPE
jgi:hypothetical protein